LRLIDPGDAPPCFVSAAISMASSFLFIFRRFSFSQNKRKQKASDRFHEDD
jgi:hypothetical protein